MKLTTTRLIRSVRRPWQRRRVRPYPREIMVLDKAPLAQIDIYTDIVVLTRRESSGTWRSYPISPDALVQALGKLPSSSGILPSGTIGTGARHGVPFYIQYIPPRRIDLPALVSAQETVYQFRTPALIWGGCGTDYRIWAIREVDRVGPGTVLYQAPFPNVYTRGGGICWGSARPPVATPSGMGQALKLFLEESRFNDHLANGKSVTQPANVLLLHATLTADQEYPVADLVATGVDLRQVLSGAAWGL